MTSHVLDLIMVGLVVGGWTTFIIVNARYQPDHQEKDDG